MKFDSDRKQLFKYFRSFIILLLIATLTLAGLQYVYADSLMQKDAAANSRNMFTLLKHTHDTLFQQLELPVAGILSNAQFQYFMDFYNGNQVNRMIEVYEQLMAMKQSTALIENICLYYPEGDITVSTNQSLSSLAMYHAKDFLLSLRETDISGHKTFLRKVYYVMSNTPTEVVSIVRTLPTMVVSGKPDAYVVIDLKMSVLSAAFEEVTIGNNASLMIFDETGAPISVTGRHYAIGDLLGEGQVPTTETMYNRVKLDGEDLFVYSAVSSDMDWTYVYVQNAGEFNSKLLLMRNTSFLICAGVLILGLVYAWIASKKLYKPIQRISEQLGNPDVDVFDRIDDVVQRNEQLDQALQENVITGRNHQLLHQIMLNFGTRESENTQLRLEPGETECALFLFGTDSDQPGLSQERLSSLLRPFHMRPLIRLYTGQCEIACIVAAGTFTVESMHDSAQAILASQPEDCAVSVGVSRPFTHVGMLQDSYRQASDALGMRLVRGNGTICCFWEIRNRPAPDYPYKIENAILRAFKTFESSNVCAEMQAFEDYLVENDASASAVRDFYTQLFCSFQRLLLELPINSGSAAAFSHRDLLKLTSISDMTEYMLRLFNTLMETCEKPNVKSEVIDRVCAFIEAHLAEAPTVETIASEFFMSVSSLRMEFQRARGISIKNYTDQVRMEVAKRTLSDGSRKIQDIARDLGFNYAQSFIAFFKSASGQTPGEYRAREQFKKIEGASANANAPGHPEENGK